MEKVGKPVYYTKLFLLSFTLKESYKSIKIFFAKKEVAEKINFLANKEN